MSLINSTDPKEVQKYIAQHIKAQPGNVDIWLSILIANDQLEIAEWLIHHHHSQIFTNDKARYTLFSRAIGQSKILTEERIDWLVKTFNVKDQHYREWLVSDADRNKQPNASILYLINSLGINKDSQTVYMLFRAACGRNDVISASMWFDTMRSDCADGAITAATITGATPFIETRKLFVESCYKNHLDMAKFLNEIHMIDHEMIDASLRVVIRKHPPFCQETAQWLVDKGAKVTPDIVLHIQDPDVFSWILTRKIFIRADIVGVRSVVCGVLEQTIHAHNWPLASWYLTEFFDEIDEDIDDVEEDIENARKKGFIEFCIKFDAYKARRTTL